MSKPKAPKEPPPPPSAATGAETSIVSQNQPDDIGGAAALISTSNVGVKRKAKTVKRSLIGGGTK